MAGTFESKTTELDLHESVESSREGKVKINLDYLPWKIESMEIPSAKWVSGKFGLEFAIEQIEWQADFS